MTLTEGQPPERMPPRRSFIQRLFTRRRPEDRTRFRPEKSSRSHSPLVSPFLTAAAQSDSAQSSALQPARTSRPVARRSSRVVVMALLALSGIGVTGVTLVAYAPQLVDRFGYESYYSRIEPDGRRFQLERKRATWLPGGEVRCLVVESDGTHRAFEVAELVEPNGTEASPEHRIQTALRGKIDAGSKIGD